MNVAFWDNTLSERGTTTSLFDYAYYNQSILKNKSYIFYTNGQNNNGNVINKFKKHFIVTKVNNFEEVDTYLLKYQITHIYIIKYGLIDDRISKVAKNCIHSVFDCRQPHGDIYASISPWVDYYTETIPVVPHMINLPQCSENLRDKLNIPKNAVVFGGYGGKMQFNIPFVHNTVLKVAETHPNIYFLFANFKPINGSQIHSNIIYVPTIIDLEEKVKFINTCDAMLWGRDDGETFGISIGEFSTHNKPVIMTDIGKRAHVHLLGNKGIKYTNAENLTEILINFNPEVESKKDWNAYHDYTPTKVMSQFQSIFLSYKSHFTFIPNKTQINNDLKRDTEFRNDNSLSQEMKLEKYMQTAFFNKACAGFSTLGYYKSSIDELTTSRYFKNGDGLYIKKIYNDGIYICGCVKNCAKYLQEVFNNIQFISAFFQKCYVVIAYDNSHDESLTILKKISQEMNLSITILEGKNISKKNVVNICNARNSILDYIRKQQQDPKQSNFKYMLMMDMDDVSASPINMQVFHNTMKREKEWDSITFNQQDYYDIWALSIDDYVCSIWHFESKPYLGAKKENVRKLKQYISEKIKNVKKDELIECKSAFNGVGIYKLDKFIHSHYEYDIKKTLRYITADEIKRNEEKMGYHFNINSWSGQYDCEHRYFHLKAQRMNKEHLKICINPQFLFKNYIEYDYSYKDIFFHKLNTITAPTKPITWAKNPKKLTCCIVEPRTMPELNGVLNNMAKIYGNTDEVGLRIYHGTENINFIKNIAEKWKNTELINLNVDNLKISEYSNLLTKKSFYKSFSSSHILIFQTDSYIFKQIPEYYFNFDYVGAPWPWPEGNGCGNGGISLRKVATMIETTTKEGIYTAEDLHFTKQNLKTCDDRKLHEQFSVEHIFNETPVCCHQPYHCMEKNKRALDFLNKIV